MKSILEKRLEVIKKALEELRGNYQLLQGQFNECSYLLNECVKEKDDKELSEQEVKEFVGGEIIDTVQ
jgi:hypothetical protein